MTGRDAFNTMTQAWWRSLLSGTVLTGLTALVAGLALEDDDLALTALSIPMFFLFSAACGFPYLVFVRLSLLKAPTNEPQFGHQSIQFRHWIFSLLTLVVSAFFVRTFIQFGSIALIVTVYAGFGSFWIHQRMKKEHKLNQSPDPLNTTKA